MIEKRRIIWCDYASAFQARLFTRPRHCLLTLLSTRHAPFKTIRALQISRIPALHVRGRGHDAADSCAPPRAFLLSNRPAVGGGRELSSLSTPRGREEERGGACKLTRWCVRQAALECVNTPQSQVAPPPASRPPLDRLSFHHLPSVGGGPCQTVRVVCLSRRLESESIEGELHTVFGLENTCVFYMPDD